MAARYKYIPYWKKFLLFIQGITERDFKGFKIGDIIYKSILFVSFLIFISLMYPSGISYQYSNLKVGMISPQKITAPFTFPILKTEEELKEEKRQVFASVKDVFKKDNSVANIELIKFDNFKKEILENRKLIDTFSSYKDSIPHDINLRMDSLLYAWRTKYNLVINKRSIVFLSRLIKTRRFESFFSAIKNMISEVYKKGIIDIPRYELVSEEISVKDGKKEYIAGPRDFFHLEEASYYIKRKSTATFQNNDYVILIDAFIRAFVKPNLFYQQEETQRRRKVALANIPTTRGFVYEGQLIVDKGEIVTPEIYNMLHSLAVAQAEKGATFGSSGNFLFNLGKYIFNAILILILAFYIRVFRPEKFKNPSTLFLLYIIFVMQFGIDYLFLHVLHWPPLSLPLVLLPILISMLIDSGTAFSSVIIASFFTAGMLGLDIHFALYSFFPGVAAIYSTRRLRKRSDTLRAAVIVILAFLVTYFSLNAMRFTSLPDMAKEAVIPLVVTGISMIAVYMLIIIFEQLFDLTTDITLLELSDLNHPLLKQLSVKSPGTFHHSLIMGNMAEAAAMEIGANPLLARVGCYYHDIGKMLRPEYFVENQLGAENRHESLQPNMSALILKKHVLEGLELADKYNLPSAVKNFIPEHHGTSIMQYFYNKAKEMFGEENVNEEDYRYPGPKPQTKETAIAMLADVSEAAVRSLKIPDGVKIKQTIEDLIKSKFVDGQFDECNLTLRELNKIAEAFVKILRGSYHERIEYPKEQTSKKEQALNVQLKNVFTEDDPGKKKTGISGKKNKKNNTAGE